jgi:ribosomal protein L34E
MVSPGKRFMKKRFVKITKGVKKEYKRFKPKAQGCAICEIPLLGVPRDTSKLSKTEKRPSIIFGGVLCSKCRDSVFDQTIMLKIGLISENQVGLTERHYVKEALHRVC